VDEVFPGIFLIDESDDGGGWRELTWFIDHEAGGILVDPQDFVPPTAVAVDRLGGASVLFITHGESVADVCKFKERYRARIVMHRADAGAVKRCAVDVPFETDFSVFQGVRALHVGVHTPGSAMLYVMRDRGYLFAGDVLTVTGGRGAPVLQPREGADPAALRRLLLHLRSVRFGAVLPFHSKHERANWVAGQGEAMMDALLKEGNYRPR
jgi:glyoxylase-like metal-dependent hydrolase (beta-lactamase superfamily II)